MSAWLLAYEVEAVESSLVDHADGVEHEVRREQHRKREDLRAGASTWMPHGGHTTACWMLILAQCAHGASAHGRAIAAMRSPAHRTPRLAPCSLGPRYRVARGKVRSRRARCAPRIHRCRVCMTQTSSLRQSLAPPLLQHCARFKRSFSIYARTTTDTRTSCSDGLVRARTLHTHQPASELRKKDLPVR